MRKNIEPQAYTYRGYRIVVMPSGLGVIFHDDHDPQCPIVHSQTGGLEAAREWIDDLLA